MKCRSLESIILLNKTLHTVICQGPEGTKAQMVGYFCNMHMTEQFNKNG